MPRVKIEKKLDLFLDRGIRYYLKRVFWDDFNIKREIDLAGCMSEIDKIDGRLPSTPRPEEDLSSNDEIHESYNDLVKRLNNFADHASTQEGMTWENLEADIMGKNGYFNQGLKIYQYIEGVKREGYHLNTANGALYYCNGQDMRLVCQLNNDANLSALFPNLYKSRGILDTLFLRQQSMKLTPELFFSMISKAQNDSPSREIKFYTKKDMVFPADRKFVNLFTTLNTRYGFVEAKRGYHNDERDRVTLVKDLINSMNKKIDGYLDAGKHSQDKIDVMHAIKTYLEDGDADKFAAKIGKTDTWFAWLKKKLTKSDEVDRAVSMIQEMQGSRFFQIALGEVISENKSQEVAMDVDVFGGLSELQELDISGADDFINVEDYASAKSELKEYWGRCRISSAAFLEALYTLEDTLGNEQPNNVTLPKIELTEEIKKDLGILASLSNFDEQDVVEHIRSIISHYKSGAQDGIGLDFNSRIAELHYAIKRILHFPYAAKEGTKAVTTAQGRFYNDLGSSLDDTFQNIKSGLKEEEKFMISAGTVQTEIDRVQQEFKEVRKKLTDFRQKLLKIGQNDIYNDIGTFLDIRLAQMERELTDSSGVIKTCRRDTFDMNQEVLDSDYQKIKEVVNNLKSFGNQVVADMSVVLEYNVDVRQEDDTIKLFDTKTNKAITADNNFFIETNKRQYENVSSKPDSAKDRDNKPKFQALQKDFSALIDSLGEKCAFNTDTIESQSNSARLSKSSMFSGVQEDTDSETGSDYGPNPR